MNNKQLADLHISMILTTQKCFRELLLIVPTIAGIAADDRKLMLCQSGDAFKQAAQIIMAVEQVVRVSFSSKQGNGAMITTWDREDRLMQTCLTISKGRLEAIDAPLRDIEYSELLTPIEVTPEMVKAVETYKKEAWYIED